MSSVPSAQLNIMSVGVVILNTLVRLFPIAIYAGSSMSGLLFDDFRGTLLFAGLMINEFIAYGYRLIMSGIYNPQCALMKTEEDFFVLPSPITQTYGFFFGFIIADMYTGETFKPWKFFVLLSLFMLVIYSRVNVGCKTFIDALYCSLLGIALGVGYYNLVKDYYKPTFYSLETAAQSANDFFKLD
jgi:hypothetical protein